MKRLTLTLACALMIGASATFAQDSTRTKSQTPAQTPTQQPSQSSDQMRKDDMKGWTTVQSSEVPGSLRTTLGGSQYSGWDNGGTIYKNEAGEYRLNMGSGTSQKSYYFDKNGKAISRPNPH